MMLQFAHWAVSKISVIDAEIEYSEYGAVIWMSGLVWNGELHLFFPMLGVQDATGEDEAVYYWKYRATAWLAKTQIGLALVKNHITGFGF